jgi:hypothetical protein|tara:strand:+ start:531 stop:1226 length:696 start_codon:yes stop_codon:yes gene_type:complete
MAELLSISGSFKVTGSDSNFIDGQLGLGTTSPGVQLEVIGTVSGSSISTGSFGRVEASTLSGDGTAITGVTAEWDGSHTGNGAITGNFTVTGTVSGSELNAFETVSGSSTSTGSFGAILADTSISGSSVSTGSFGSLFGNGANLTGLSSFDASAVDENIIPDGDNTRDLGSAGARWANVYTADFHLSNVNGIPNKVDGTAGSWTIQEGKDKLYLVNNESGKKYSFVLREEE